MNLRRFFSRDLQAEPLRPLTYLACPYSHPNPDVRELRFRAANIAAAELMRKGETVFSPITNSHILVPHGLPGDWEFWKKVDTDFLLCSKKVVVLKIPGWKESKGVTEEIKIAEAHGIPVDYFSDCFLPAPLIGDLYTSWVGGTRFATLETEKHAIEVLTNAKEEQITSVQQEPQTAGKTTSSRSRHNSNRKTRGPGKKNRA